MQINIKFYKNDQIVLPIQYNHIVQAFIYNIIDMKLASFLHNNGFGDSRKFKMFTFSKLYGKYNIKTKPGFIIYDKELNLTICSPFEEFCKSFVNGIIQKKIFLGENELEIVSAEINPIIIEKDEILCKTLSPIVAYSTLMKHGGSKYTIYFEPKENEFEKQINLNLKHKYEAFYNYTVNDFNIKINPISKYKQNIINYKDFIIKGYSGLFKINGPKEILRFAIETGLGSKNSMGFGCLKIIDKKV